MHLWCIALLVIILTMMLAGKAIFNSISEFSKAKNNLSDVVKFASVVEAANRISQERGPANILMTANEGARNAAYIAWQDAIQKTDDALSKLDTSIIPDDLVQDVREQLRRGRMKVEATQLKEPGAFRYNDIHSAIFQMFQAWDSYEKIVEWQGTELLRRDDNLAAVVLRGTMLSNVREYAGRLGSYLIAPIAMKQPITAKNETEIRMIEGQICELWRLLQSGSNSKPESSPIRQKREEANSLYIVQGLALIDELIQAGQQDGLYFLDTATFTTRYVAAMKPLGELRNIYLSASIAEFEILERTARQALYNTSLIAFVILALVISLVVAVQRYIFIPLFRAAEAIVSLADDLPTGLFNDSRHVTEIQTLYSALEVISVKLKERSFLMSRLEHLAHTDGLTGLLNRRALDALGNLAAQDSCNAEFAPYLILADVDYFKVINDKYGHLAGDQVLKKIARLMRDIIDESDHVARFGGEEFAILLNCSSHAEAAMIVQNLRLAMEQLSLEMPGGANLKITASFGVAEFADQSWNETINRADQALYRAKKTGRNRVHFAGHDAIF